MQTLKEMGEFENTLILYEVGDNGASAEGGMVGMYNEMTTFNGVVETVAEYFEMFGNRAIYNDGWVAATVHKAPWELEPRHALAEDVWELYNIDKDFSETVNLAASEPQKLKQLQALFMKEAKLHRALPIDDRVMVRFDPDMAGRPDLMNGRKSLTVYEGMTGMMENAFINVKNTSFTIMADVAVPSGAASGVILCQGGRFGGWSLYVKDGKPAFTYNFVGLKEFTVNGSDKLGPGKSTITLEFAYDGNGRGKGGTASLFVNKKKIGSGRIEQTNANIFSADDAADVGVDEGTNVSSAYKQGDNKFSGKIDKVRVDVK